MSQSNNQARYDDDVDSAYGSEVQSSTASLTESIYRYRQLYGRSFHSDFGLAESWGPNDERHANAMDSFHHTYSVMLEGKLFLAPIRDNVQKILDIGTGTGIWTIDVGDLFPQAVVIGTDITPIQTRFAPPNVRYELEDAKQPWTYEDDTFDFVHVRGMIGVIADWDAFYREAFRVCKPGGFFEDMSNSCNIISDDGSVEEGSPMDIYGKVLWEGGKKLGHTFRHYEDDIQRKGMEAAGFVDIVTHEFRAPIGTWPTDPGLKEIGLWTRYSFSSDAEGKQSGYKAMCLKHNTY